MIDKLYRTLAMATICASGCATEVAFDAPVEIFVDGESPIVVVEGQTATATLRLTRRPRSTVRLALTSGDPTEAPLSTSSISIAPEDWQEPITFSMVTPNDAIAEGTEQIAITVDSSSSSDPDYADLAPTPVFVIVLDDDEPNVLTVLSGGTLAETALEPYNLSFTVRLQTAPDETIRFPITIDPSWDDYIETEISEVVFTPLNYQTPQTIRLRAVDDGVNHADGPFEVIIGDSVSTFTYVDND
jgi:hypothetical protein